jgi:hypothetical protein
MKADRKQMNKDINLLYRQLGKEICQTMKSEQLPRKSQKIIKQINKKIQIIEKSVPVSNKKHTLINKDLIKSTEDTITPQIPLNASILQPEANEDGLIMYKFCTNCHTGNNPKSTHCLGCYQPLI